MEERLRSQPIQLLDRPSQQLSHLRPSPSYRNGHLSLHTFSPVNENGSFEFDRVLKSGKVFRRVKSKHAFKASWKPVHLVLRPNLLSVYKDEEATQLTASITLSDVTAVAKVKSGSNRQYVFGIFTLSKNYRFEAATDRDLEDWIKRIRAETRVDEDEEEFLATMNTRRENTLRNRPPIDDTTDHSDFDHMGLASSPDADRSNNLSPNTSGMRLSFSQEYSGNEITSYSDWSDGPSGSINLHSPPSINLFPGKAPANKPVLVRRGACPASELGVFRDPEKVVCQGYLLCLRITGGVRQWHRLWVVVRPKSLCFYKDEQEYSAVKVIPMSQVIDAAEIDPISKSKHCCLQIITEDKSYRLCAPDEESLAMWLGSLKSIIVARKKLKSKLPLAPAPPLAVTSADSSEPAATSRHNKIEVI